MWGGLMKICQGMKMTVFFCGSLIKAIVTYFSTSRCTVAGASRQLRLELPEVVNSAMVYAKKLLTNFPCDTATGTDYLTEAIAQDSLILLNTATCGACAIRTNALPK